MSEIIYRELNQLDGFRATVELQRAVWGSTFDPVPLHVFQAVTARGGLLVGGEHEGQMVGFAFAFPANEGQGWILWSHIAGVHPDYQGHGIGFRLKQMQRVWALEQGYDRMGWTFDPMQRGNANFNLRLLGAVSNTYKLNIYGEMTDAVNRGLQSDRLAVTWFLNDERVARLAEGAAPEPIIPECPEERFILRYTGEGLRPSPTDAALDADYYLAELPRDLNTLKRDDLELAKQWQLELRQTFQKAFAAGYWVVDVMTTDDCCWYVLQKELNTYV
jgi:predicted GNAT superfamily acetyltransferase